MAHYTFLDENNVVVEVIVGKDENDTSQNWEEYYGNIRGLVCKRTSYNSYHNTHSNENKTAFRKNYAGIGFLYDENLDAFIPPKPFESWVLNENTCDWEAPVSKPNDGQEYKWNENTLSWELITE
jgi:hypothetical protein